MSYGRNLDNAEGADEIQDSDLLPYEEDFQRIQDQVDRQHLQWIDYPEESVIEVIRRVHQRFQAHLVPRLSHQLAIRDCVRVSASSSGCEGEPVGFLMSRYPVTNAQYKAFLNDTAHLSVDSSGRRFPYPYSANEWESDYSWQEDGSYPPGKGNQPAVLVTWDDARAYAEWVGGRLPTIRDWELAARGQPARAYPWGDSFNPHFCNVLESRIGKTTPVDQYPQGVSPYGCFDMVGNAWAWLDDEPKPGHRMLYGGSFYNSITMHQWPVSQPWPHTFKARDVGFRVLFDTFTPTYPRPSPPTNRRKLKDGTELVLIEGREFFVGPERESRKVETFAIGIYPIQNWQYYRFLTENYRMHSRPALEEDPEHLWPAGWGESYPDQQAGHPVTGLEPPAMQKYLSWVYEGVATLPTENEWLLAAYGPHGWLYPWGDCFDVNCCNVYESGHGATALVNAYPAGVSYFGCYDMAGNCFELLESRRNRVEHIIRGGSYLLDHAHASCLSSRPNAPLNCALDLGFRMATHAMVF